MNKEELQYAGEAIKLYTMHTPSHKEMCERFVVANADAAGFDHCVVFKSEQICESGNYNTSGFAETCWLKLDALATIPVGTKACYVDADCILLPGLARWCEEWLVDNAGYIGHGNDAGLYCTGVLVFEQTPMSTTWWKWLRMLAWMIQLHDQTALNEILGNVKRIPVGVSHLPNNIFANWTTGGHLPQRKWQGESLVIPDSTLCWHANFCIGVEQKVKMLEIVSEKLLMNHY